MYLIYKHDARGREAPEGGVLMVQSRWPIRLNFAETECRVVWALAVHFCSNSSQHLEKGSA